MASKPWIEDRWKDSQGRRTSSFQQGQRWKVYWWEEAFDDGHYARRRLSRRFRTKPEAEHFVFELQHAQYTGTYVSPTRSETLFATAAEEWIQGAHDIKESTHHRYSRELRSYVLPRWGAHPLNSISRREITAWISQLANGTAPASYAQGRAKKPPPAEMRRPLSAASIKHVFHVFAAVLTWAVDAGLLASSPATRIRLPRTAQSEHVYLTHSEIASLASAAMAVSGRATDRDLMNLLAYTGLRINEALALRVGSLDLSHQRLRVAASWTKGKDGKMRLGLPKSGRPRAVGIPAFLVEDLHTLTAGMDLDEFVFQTPRGGPRNDHNWRTRVFNLARTGAGLDGTGLTPHGLRHTAASAAIAAGADVKVVQQMLGHTDASETLNTYSHLWPDRLNEVSDALNAARDAMLGHGAPKSES